MFNAGAGIGKIFWCWWELVDREYPFENFFVCLCRVTPQNIAKDPQLSFVHSISTTNCFSFFHLPLDGTVTAFSNAPWREIISEKCAVFEWRGEIVECVEKSARSGLSSPRFPTCWMMIAEIVVKILRSVNRTTPWMGDKKDNSYNYFKKVRVSTFFCFPKWFWGVEMWAVSVHLFTFLRFSSEKLCLRFISTVTRNIFQRGWC